MTATPSEAELFARAAEAWQQGRPQAATQLLHALLEDNPRHVTALNTLGLIAIGVGGNEEALVYFERAAAADPTAPGIWFNHFQALEAVGDLPRGLDSLDRALRIDP